MRRLLPVGVAGRLALHPWIERSMTPRQIIAQFKATLVAMAAVPRVANPAWKQQMVGAFTVASRLISFHPQLSGKGATRPYLVELKKLLECYSCDDAFAPGDTTVSGTL
jgi:hypothetical protein